MLEHDCLVLPIYRLVYSHENAIFVSHISLQNPSAVASDEMPDTYLNWSQPTARRNTHLLEQNNSREMGHWELSLGKPKTCGEGGFSGPKTNSDTLGTWLKNALRCEVR